MADLNDDIFGYKRNPKPKGVFSTENSKLTFGVDGGDDVDPEGYLVQNWNVSYSQDVQELFEIGSNRLYWAKGRPTGAGALGRVIGAQAADTDKAGFFPKAAYDICQGGATMVLTAGGGKCDFKGTNVDQILNQGINIVMSGCVVTQIGFSMAVADVRLMENFAWRFAYMKLEAKAIPV